MKIWGIFFIISLDMVVMYVGVVLEQVAAGFLGVVVARSVKN